MSTAPNTIDGKTSPWPWHQMISASADGDDGNVVGTCTAHLIERGDDPILFDMKMIAPADETTKLASDLFTPRGTLREEHRGEKARAGDAIWDSELDTGDILLFEHIKVSKTNRRRGMAKDLVKAVLNEAKQASNGRFVCYVAPGALESEYKIYEGEEREKAIEEDVSVCIQFWHAQGFRRVGASTWLALVVQPNDP